MDPRTVEAALEDYETAPIDRRLRAALRLIEALTLHPQRFGRADIDYARAEGLADQAIEEVMYICFAFNVINRLADALGFDLSTPEQRDRVVQVLHRTGYAVSVVPG